MAAFFWPGRAFNVTPGLGGSCWSLGSALQAGVHAFLEKSQRKN